jgi:enoyl-CoA hydratase
MSGSVDCSHEGGVAILTIDNVRIKNALTNAMAAQLVEHCERIDADPAVGCVVIRGAEGTFSSGADRQTWADTYGEDPLGDRAYDMTDEMYGSFMRVGALKAPTIAAVRGAAVGAGFNLALATDMRIVAQDARLLAGFVAAGIHPGGGFFSLVRRAAGREVAGMLGLFGQELSGARAAALGLAGMCVDDGEVDETALRIARQTATDPLLARRIKRSFQIETAGAQLEWPAALEIERGVQLWSQNRRLKGIEPAE